MAHINCLKDSVRSANSNARLILKKLSLASRNLNHTLNDTVFRDNDFFFNRQTSLNFDPRYSPKNIYENNNNDNATNYSNANGTTDESNK